MSRAELPAAFESGMTMALDVHAVLADLAAPLLEAKLLQSSLGWDSDEQSNASSMSYQERWVDPRGG